MDKIVTPEQLKWMDKLKEIVELRNKLKIGRWYHDAAKTPWDVCIWNMDAKDDEDDDESWIANVGGRAIAAVDDEIDSERDIADFIVKCHDNVVWIHSALCEYISGKEIKRIGYIISLMYVLDDYYNKIGRELEYNNDVECAPTVCDRKRKNLCASLDDKLGKPGALLVGLRYKEMCDKCESDTSVDESCSVWIGAPLNRKFEGNVDPEAGDRDGLVDVGNKENAEFITACFRYMSKIIDGVKELLMEKSDYEDEEDED